MTNERPVEDARCWLFNTADRAVDVYVNYQEEPLTTIQPTEDQGVFSIDSDASRVYGTYTFEAREAGDPDDDPLASVSVAFEAGDSYALAFHQIADAEYGMSVYKNDFSSSGDTRFEIRHTGRPAEIHWELSTAEHADPRIPEDSRSGTLQRGQWQQALDVTENEYRLEISVDDRVVAFRQDLELEANRMIVVYLLGDPQPWMGADEKEDHILRQEYQIQTGPRREDVVTPPAAPYATTDTNRTIQFDCEPVELFHTNWTEVEIGATDPDGIVNDLAVNAVMPYSDGYTIPDESVDRAFAIGGETTATLQVRPKVPPATYAVQIISNPNSLGERVVCDLPVEVKPITIARLHGLVEHYHEAGRMTDWLAGQLHDVLEHAEDHLDAGEDMLACEALNQVITLVGEYKDDELSVPATVDIETETKAFRRYLGCG